MKNNIYVELELANLHIYNCGGSFVGGWITLPTTESEIDKFLETVVHADKDDYFIVNWISNLEGLCKGLNINETTDIYELNEKLLALPEVEDMTALKAAMKVLFVEEAFNAVHNGNFTLYHGCFDMEEIARIYVRETGLLANIPVSTAISIAMYFDYKKYGENLAKERNFVKVPNVGIYEFY